MDSIKKFAKAVKASQNSGTKPYDTPATVRRIDGKTAYVHIPGGVDETPVELTINAVPGDTVRVRVSGGRAWITGNNTSPPTDDTKAEQAIKETGIVAKAARFAREVAETASRIAGKTAQFFWVTTSGDDTGAHVTEIPREAFLADPEHGGGNLLARSNGIAVRDGLQELATMSQDGFEVSSYDSNGNPVEIAHLGYDDAQSYIGQVAKSPYYSIGTRVSSISAYSTSRAYTAGDRVIYNNMIFGCHTDTPSPAGSFSYQYWAELGHADELIGQYSYAEGQYALSAGTTTHAEGYQSSAGAWASHSEGYRCIAGGVATTGAHAEGHKCTATGQGAHAEGVGCVASGKASHAEGSGCIADQPYQHAMGVYNEPNSDDLWQIGYGTAVDARKNIFAVDKTGMIKRNDHPFFVVETVSWSATIPASQTNDFDHTISKNGYTPIGMVGFDLNGSGIAGCRVIAAKVSSGKAFFQIRNDSSNSISATFYMDVLFMAN